MTDMWAGWNDAKSPKAQLIDEVYAATGIRLNANLVSATATRDELLAKAVAVKAGKRAKGARRAGLINKYGRELANEIASRHAGRAITLR